MGLSCTTTEATARTKNKGQINLETIDGILNFYKNSGGRNREKLLLS